MNELLQKHGCSNVFTVPEGLKELMSDITREVLRAQPRRLLDFIANYLSALLITREHGIMAVKILDDLCDCRPTVTEHLLQLGLERNKAEELATIIKSEIESCEPTAGKETVKEYLILKKLLFKVPMDEEMSTKVCQVARNAYRDYWYRKDLLKQGMKKQEEEPWELAAQHTLALYKRTKPTLSELCRATEKIQAAYKGYHVRRNVLRHLLPKKDKKQGRKVDLSGPPQDVGGCREIDLGPVINIRTAVEEDNVDEMFAKEKTAILGLPYDATRTITHVEDDQYLKDAKHRKGVKLSCTIEPSDDTPGEKGPRYADETPEVAHGGLLGDDDDDISVPAPSYNRISFSEIPPHVIRELDEDELAEVPEVSEAQDDGGPGLAGSHDDAQEVPEDIMLDEDEYTDSAGLSGPVSTAETAGTGDPTDIEDEAEGEEEEE